MERVYGRVNDFYFIKKASCKRVSSCVNLSAIFYEFTTFEF